MPCYFCEEPGHVVLCSDELARSICPDCKSKFETIEKLFKNQQKIKYKKDWDEVYESYENKTT
jgi:transcriptional regulator NrdR family protein